MLLRLFLLAVSVTMGGFNQGTPRKLAAFSGRSFCRRFALHEAILFEQWQQRVRSGALETQRLLIPETVNLPALQAARVLEHAAELSELGLMVEDFGGGTVLLTGYPALLRNTRPRPCWLTWQSISCGRHRVEAGLSSPSKLGG